MHCPNLFAEISASWGDISVLAKQASIHTARLNSFFKGAFSPSIKEISVLRELIQQKSDHYVSFGYLLTNTPATIDPSTNKGKYKRRLLLELCIKANVSRLSHERKAFEDALYRAEQVLSSLDSGSIVHHAFYRNAFCNLKLFVDPKRDPRKSHFEEALIRGNWADAIGGVHRAAKIKKILDKKEPQLNTCPCCGAASYYTGTLLLGQAAIFIKCSSCGVQTPPFVEGTNMVSGEVVKLESQIEKATAVWSRTSFRKTGVRS